jgi:hypothetical protein
MLEKTSGTNFNGINKNAWRIVPIWRLCFCGFPREKIHVWANLRKDGLAHSGYSNAYPITLLFLFLLTILNQTQYWSMLTN